MKKIIVATDLSKAAMNAAVYATHIAKELKLSVELYNAYVIPFTYTQAPMPMDTINEIEQITMEELQKEKAFLEEKIPGVSISIKTTPGDIIDNLKADINPDENPFIVFGTSGKGDNILWGSIATKALRSFSVPVLAVPKNIRWHGVNQISLAIDYNNIPSDTPLKDLQKVLQLFNAQLNIINVHKEDTKPETPDLLKMALNEMHPEYFSYKAMNVSEGVNQHEREQEPSWLAVLPQKYGFFESLFHSSQTKQIAQTTDIPILALGNRE